MLSVYFEIPVLSTGHPPRNSLFMKAIRDVHSVFQDRGLKIKNNQTILAYTAISECVCAALK
jgi:hypothetical protein